MRKASCMAIVASLAIASTAAAAPVMDFFTLRGTTATTLSGTGNTDDPVLGTVAETADGARLIGYFTPQSLTNIGDSITLSYSMSFTEGTIVNSSDNWRYALYDRNGGAQEATNSNLAVVGTTNTQPFRGYWLGVDTNPNATGAQGTLRERPGTTADVDPFTNNSATNLTNPTGLAVLAAGNTYTGTMTIALTGVNEVTITGSFTGAPAGGSNAWSFVDTTPAATSYSVVGFLNGGGINADQVTFSNVDVTFVPEPAAAGVLALGALAAATRRRRHRGI